MSWYEFIIELLRIFISWPFVAGIVLIYVFWNYKKPIEDWLRYSPKRGSLAGVGTFESGPITQETEKPKSASEETVADNPEAKAKFWHKLWYFERVWNMIYRSQIEILEHLSEQGDKGATWNYLFNFYANAAKLYPILLGYSYDKYMNFLITNDLIKVKYNNAEPTNSDVSITDFGKEFLQYLNAQRHTKEVKIW